MLGTCQANPSHGHFSISFFFFFRIFLSPLPAPRRCLCPGSPSATLAARCLLSRRVCGRPRVPAPEHEVASPAAGLKASPRGLFNLFAFPSASQGPGTEGKAARSCRYGNRHNFLSQSRGRWARASSARPRWGHLGEMLSKSPPRSGRGDPARGAQTQSAMGAQPDPRKWGFSPRWAHNPTASRNGWRLGEFSAGKCCSFGDGACPQMPPILGSLGIKTQRGERQGVQSWAQPPPCS